MTLINHSHLEQIKLQRIVPREGIELLEANDSVYLYP